MMGRKRGRGGGLEGRRTCIIKRCEALKDKLLRDCVKSQLDDLTAVTFTLKFTLFDLLKTHLTLAVVLFLPVLDRVYFR